MQSKTYKWFLQVFNLRLGAIDRWIWTIDGGVDVDHFKK